MAAPLILFVFNRPDTTARVLAAVKEQTVRPEKLLIFSDGPRHAEDEPTVQAVRRLVRAVDWAQVKICERERNVGCAPNILQGLTEAFRTFESAVVLEDDTLPARCWYEAMNLLLDHYRDQPQLFSVGGYPSIKRGAPPAYPHDVILSARFSCWGWGTWASRWNALSEELLRFRSPYARPRDVPIEGGFDLPFTVEAIARRPEFYWDAKVALLCLSRGWLHALTTNYLVNNIGTDSGAHGDPHMDYSFQERHSVLTEELPRRFAPPVSLPEVSRAVQEYVADNYRATHKAEPPTSRPGLARRVRDALRRRLGGARAEAVRTKANASGWLRLIPAFAKRLLPARFKAALVSVGRGDPDAPVLGLGQDKLGRAARRALVSYITLPFHIGPSDPRQVRFSNFGIARGLVRALNELGYVVDLIDWKDTRFEVKRRYDLFIGHGGRNVPTLIRRLPEAVKIYFSTGIYWKEWNRREAERFDALERRRGVRLPYDRWVTDPEEEANRLADAILCLGNAEARRTYAGFPLVVGVNNAAYPAPPEQRSSRNMAEAKNHFLFFAGAGNVHKGLDLLLEAFAGLPAHLHVCQEIEPEFRNAYRRELEGRDNIHTVGWVHMRTPAFHALASECAFVINPSCAEGQPGGVVECMHYGLIPIVSRESNLDTDNFGVMLDPCSVEELARVVSDLSDRPTEWCEMMSRRVQRAAEDRFSEGAFLRNTKDALVQIVKEKTGYAP